MGRVQGARHVSRGGGAVLGRGMARGNGRLRVPVTAAWAFCEPHGPRPPVREDMVLRPPRPPAMATSERDESTPRPASGRSDPVIDRTIAAPLPPPPAAKAPSPPAAPP